MTTDDDRAIFWERTAKVAQARRDYYQEKLVEAHALIGRLMHQMSDENSSRDHVNLTRWTPVGKAPVNWVPVTTEEILAEEEKRKAQNAAALKALDKEPT